MTTTRTALLWRVAIIVLSLAIGVVVALVGG
jgi:hypothetical protein